MINYGELLIELNTDPLALGYANKTTTDVADILNLKQYSATRHIPIAELMAYIHRNNLWVPLEDASQNTNLPQQLRDAARMGVAVATARYDSIDSEVPIFAGLLYVLELGGIVTSQQAQEITDLKNTTISRCEALFGVDTSITFMDVLVVKNSV